MGRDEEKRERGEKERRREIIFIFNRPKIFTLEGCATHTSLPASSLHPPSS